MSPYSLPTFSSSFHEGEKRLKLFLVLGETMNSVRVHVFIRTLLLNVEIETRGNGTAAHEH